MMEGHVAMLSEGRAAWERQPHEPVSWFLRFCAYRAQRPPRSAVAVYRSERERKGTEGNGKKRLDLIDCIPASWAKAKQQYHWRERAEAFDIAERERHDRELSAKREAERASELKIAEELRKKARALLELPILKEVVKYNKDGEVGETRLIPEFHAFMAANALFVSAKAHARSALMMPDKIDRQEIIGKDGAPIETDNTTVGDAPAERLAKLLELAQSAATAGSRERWR